MFMRRIATAIATASLAAGPSAAATWHWVWVIADAKNGWQTFEGDCDVVRRGSSFQTTLNGTSPNWQPSVSIKGRLVKGGDVIAVVVLLNSDADAETYRGSMVRNRSKRSDPSAGWGYDRISLHSSSGFLGLYRSVLSHSGDGPR